MSQNWDDEGQQTTALARAPQAGMTMRQDASGGQELAVSGEMNQAQIVAESRARIEAEHFIAKRFPRDYDVARTRLLADCRRPRFAEKARYKKPQGRGFVEGPSIRFVESAIRAMGNLVQEARVIYDDIERRKILVVVRDLESNSSMGAEVVIDKTIERKDGRGREVLASRLNTYGDTVCIVRATEDELTTKQAALVSKAIRTIGLRLVPADLVEEAMDEVIATQKRQDKEDPDAARKRLVDAFVSVGVQPNALKDYLGHDLASCSPAQMQELRAIYAGIHSGETTWKEVLASQQTAAAAADGGDKAPTKADELKAKLAAKIAQKATRPAPKADEQGVVESAERQPGED